MNQDTLTWLGWVIEAVEKAPPRRFSMNRWVGCNWLCRTTYCAIGWACQDERVRATGLVLDMQPRLGRITGFHAVAAWLDIPEEDAGSLFGQSRESGKTKEEVLKRLRAYRDLVRYTLEQQKQPQRNEAPVVAPQCAEPVQALA